MRNAFLLLAGCTLICGGAAAAPQRSASPVNYWYVFGGYDSYKIGGVNLDAGSLGVGNRLGRYIGFQAGGQYARKYGTDVTNFYSEMVGILPLGRRFGLFATVGAAFANNSASLSGPLGTTISVSKSGTGLRTGVGAEYWFARNIGLQISYHRQNALAVGDDLGVALAYRF